jgi:hypothetical protein
MARNFVDSYLKQFAKMKWQWKKFSNRRLSFESKEILVLEQNMAHIQSFLTVVNTLNLRAVSKKWKEQVDGLFVSLLESCRESLKLLGDDTRWIRAETSSNDKTIQQFVTPLDCEQTIIWNDNWISFGRDVLDIICNAFDTKIFSKLSTLLLTRAVALFKLYLTNLVHSKDLNKEIRSMQQKKWLLAFVIIFIILKLEVR